MYFIIQTSVSNPVIFPTIDSIFSSFGGLFVGKNLVSLGYSVLRIIVSVFLSFVISFFVSYLYFIWKGSLSFIKPLLFILKVSPVVALTIYAYLILGNSDSVPYIITCAVMIPIMIDAITVSIDNIEKETIESAQLEGANKTTLFFKIVVPSILPYILLSLLQTFALGFKVSVMAEYITNTSNSIGQILYKSLVNVDMALLIAIILFIVLISAVFEFFIHLYIRKTIKQKNS